MKRTTAAILVMALLATIMVAAIPFSVSAYDNSNTYTITGYDKALPTTAHSEIYVFTNTTNSVKDYLTATYKFSASRILIFDGNGKLVEAGNSLVTGSSAPQIEISIPANGFAVAFGTNADATLQTCYATAIEDALINQETIHIFNDIYGRYDKATNKLTIEYNTPAPPSANAKKFLFVGNSCTYFNGNPLKFKGIAQAAGIEVDVTYCTWGGAKLKEFADSSNTKHNRFLSKINLKQYDYVVLQDHGSATYQETRDGVEALLPYIEANGAKPLLFMRNAYDQNLETRKENAYKIHSIFMQVAREFDIDIVAYASDAHMLCSTKYPEINLFAQDKAHQSVEGSLLFALTYAVAYLGIDVMGNSYTAGLPEETVRKLQECATLAHTEGYDFEEITYRENGVKYQNVALGKNYTYASGTPYTANLKYADVDSESNPKRKLTDSAFALSGDDMAVGAYEGKTLDITINLGGNFVIKSLRTDAFGGAWGIKDPANTMVKVAISKDGSVWTDLGNASMSEEKAITDTEWKKRTFDLVTNSDEQVAKYVKVTYSNIDTTIAKNTFWTSDIQVYGYELITNVALNKKYTANGIHTDSQGVTPYPDENGVSLTDGKYADASDDYSNKAFTAFHVTNDYYVENGYAAITVDLEDVYAIDKFVAHVSSENTSNASAGVKVPAKVEFYISDDSATWKLAGSAVPSLTDDSTSATLNLTKPVSGRYVQYRITASSNWIMVSEVEAHGEKYVAPEYMLGDLNGNDEIDAVDYSLLKRAYFGAYTTDVAIGDINGNDEIDAVDYSLLKRAYFGAYALN